MNRSERTRRIRRMAAEAGFDEAAVAVLEPLEGTEEGRRFGEWIGAGRQGSMSYLERRIERRLDARNILPGARSVLCVAINYWFPEGEREPFPGRGRVARYARGRDYHKVFDGRLRRLERRLAEEFPGTAARRHVDTGPVLEKLWAERAGLGWRGKHTNLVSRSRGSWLLLGELLLDLDLEPGVAGTDHCGTCTRCLDACPTGAITGPYHLDARLCISYLTIEHRGPVPEELRPLMGDRIFGCDDCLEVCPWNRFASAAREADFRPRPESTAPLLVELVDLDDAGFLARFAGTPLMRAKRDGLARNACIALGNTGVPGAEGALARALEDPSELVREHAAWALARLGGGG